MRLLSPFRAGQSATRRDIAGGSGGTSVAHLAALDSLDLARPDHAAQLAARLAPPPRPAWRRVLDPLAPFWLLVAFILVWQFISTFGQALNPQLAVMLPAPTTVVSAAQELIARGQLGVHIVSSLRRVLVAVGVAAAIGVPLGLAMGWWGPFRRVVTPLLEFIRPIPPLAWIPLSILWFGIGDLQNEYIIFLAAFFPVVLNTMAGTRDVGVHLVRAGLSLGASQGDLFRTVVLPAALPQIFVGLRIGLGIGWMALVAGELVAAPNGLGFMINNARTVFRSDHILLGMVLIGILGLILDALMRWLAHLVMPWYRGL